MVFPPGVPVVVEVAGRPLAAYHAAYLTGGRVYAPLNPYITSIADRMWYEGDTLVIARGSYQARITLAPRDPDTLASVYVPIAPIARELGAHVSYAAHRLEIYPGVLPLATPTPFNPALPSAAPSAVFTPTPAPTPRPVFTGVPLPRRTPIPVVAPTPRGRGRRGRAR